MGEKVTSRRHKLRRTISEYVTSALATSMPEVSSISKISAGTQAEQTGNNLVSYAQRIKLLKHA